MNPSAVSAAISVVTISTRPNNTVSTELVRPSRGPRISRNVGNGRPDTQERAYAMTDEKEHFAEQTEAFFSRNDFFPFDRAELKRHDPAMERLLVKLWGAAE